MTEIWDSTSNLPSKGVIFSPILQMRYPSATTWEYTDYDHSPPWVLTLWIFNEDTSHLTLTDQKSLEKQLGKTSFPGRPLEKIVQIIKEIVQVNEKILWPFEKTARLFEDLKRRNMKGWRFEEKDWEELPSKKNLCLSVGIGTQMNNGNLELVQRKL